MIMFKQEIKAQLTVMASLIFIIVITFVVTCVKSAEAVSCNTVIKQACSLSQESLFASYNNDLFNDYEIFALKKSDILKKKINSYINDNINTYSKQISLINAELTDYSYMTDNDGYGVEEQIIRYMKSSGYADIIKNYTHLESQIKTSNYVNDITKQITENNDNAFKSSVDMNKLFNICGNISQICTDIEQAGNNISGMYEEYKEVFANIEGTDYTEQKVRTIKKLYDSFNNEQQDISEFIKKNEDMINSAKEQIDNIEINISETSSDVEKCVDKLKDYREQLDSDLYDELYADIESMNTGQKNIDMQSDITQIQSALENTLEVMQDINTYNLQLTKSLMEINNRLQNNEEVSADYVQEVKTAVDNLSDRCKSFAIKQMFGDNSSYLNKYKSDDAKIDRLKDLYELLKGKIAQLVIDKDISDKTIDYENLSNSSINYNSDASFSDVSTDLRNYIISEYTAQHFLSYTDTLSDSDINVQNNNSQVNYSAVKNSHSDADRLLDYEMEFIIGKNNCDKDNLEEVIKKLAVIRQGCNLVYLITDSNKKAECLSIALSIVGFTGNGVAIKAVQYLIMSIWSYIEALAELKALCKGENIDLIKNAENWITGIDGIITGSFWQRDNVLGENVDIKHSDNSFGQVSYNDLLKFLIMFMNKTDRNFNIMSAMELNMIRLGHTDFRMKDYVYELFGNAAFQVEYSSKPYTQKLKYGYIY